MINNVQDSMLTALDRKLTCGIFVILLFSLLGCNTDDQDGKWDDNIKLSEKAVNLTAEGNTVVITTQGKWWWVNGIGLNDDWNYDLTETDTTRENFLIEEPEFKIERKNATEIHISMAENQTGLERILKISLQAGNYFDGIRVTQSAN